MKHLLKLSLLIMAFLLAACGGDTVDTSTDTDATGTNVDTSGEVIDNTSAEAIDNTSIESTDNISIDETNFTSTITGAVEIELSGQGYFLCDEIGELAIGASGRLSNNVFLLIPIDASADSTYEIVSERMSDDQASASYIGESIQEAYYDRNVSGSITLDAVPSRAGERVAGSFEFTASSINDNTVTVIGGFDFNVGRDAFANCSGS